MYQEASAIIIHHKLFLLLLVIAVLLSLSNVGASTITTTTTISKPPRLVMKLIHRDSIFSPYENPNARISERIRRDINSSRNIILSTTSVGDVRGGVISNNNGNLFFVNVSIGQPPVPQLVVMDSGSSLFWIQCSPCIKCFKQLSPMFDPSKSSTYRNLSCISNYCKSNLLQNGCNSGICTYNINYLDESTTRGTFGMEEVKFVTSDEGTTSILHTVIGCGHQSSIAFPGVGFSGVLGLGPNNLSLVNRIGSKFSYCIGNIEDPNYEFNQLIIGDDAKIEGYSTPIEVFRDRYYIALDGISVGEKRLDIDPKTFKRAPSGVGGVIIDSGTTNVHLVKGGFDPLRAEVKSLIGGLLQQVNDQQNPDRLCYNGNVSRDLKGFPIITFHFVGGADLVLDMDAMFVQLRDVSSFCMAMLPSGFERGLTIIGIRAQQYYNVAYDLDAMKLYFQRIDCQLLED